MSAEQLPGRVVIRGGRVIDPGRGIDQITDLTLTDGRIDGIGPSSRATLDAAVRIDATGKLVVPGLIDFHAHIYKGMSSYGVDPDRAGVLAGVTHVNDIGSTGWVTFNGFLSLVAKRAATPITCFPNIVGLGIPENWGYGNPDYIAIDLRPEQLIAQAERHRDVIRGVKVHVERGFLSHLHGETWRAFEAARAVTEALGLNLYVHLGDLFPKRDGAELVDAGSLPLEAVERMKPGEVLGHCFTQFPGGLVDDHGRVSPAAQLAHDKGVLHEVGHGLNFSFERARHLLGAGVLPDIISSDLHGTRMHAGRPRADLGLDADTEAPGLSWSMVGTMSKVLALGVPLVEVIRMATTTPARALGLAGVKGTLAAGVPAEVSILDLASGSFKLIDSVGEELRCEQLLLPQRTIIGRRTWRCDPFRLPEFRNEYARPNPDAFAI